MQAAGALEKQRNKHKQHTHTNRCKHTNEHTAVVSLVLHGKQAGSSRMGMRVRAEGRG